MEKNISKLKSKKFYEKNFNSNIINSENIEYAFSQAIFYLEYLILDENYNYIKADIKNILNYLKKWLKIYINQRSLMYLEPN